MESNFPRSVIDDPHQKPVLVYLFFIWRTFLKEGRSFGSLTNKGGAYLHHAHFSVSGHLVAQFAGTQIVVAHFQYTAPKPSYGTHIIKLCH